MGFITKNYCPDELDFLRHYGFDFNYANCCWTLAEAYGFDEIKVQITENGEDVTVTVQDRNFPGIIQRYNFRMDIANIVEKSYIDTLDRIVTTYLEEQGYDAFSNIDNRS